jgi:hypothetical protein
MESSSARSRSASMICHAALTVPVALPREIAERVEEGELDPFELFTLTLTYEAVQEHGLKERDVFWVDCPEVSLYVIEELDEPAPEDGGLQVTHEHQR